MYDLQEYFNGVTHETDESRFFAFVGICFYRKVDNNNSLYQSLGIQPVLCITLYKCSN